MRQTVTDILHLAVLTLANHDKYDVNAVLDVIPAAITVIDTNYRITGFNHGAEAISTLSRNEVIGRDVGELFGTTSPECLSAFEKALGNGETSFYNKSFFWQNRSFHILSASSPIFGHGDIITGAVNVTLDITSQREREHRMNHLESLAAIGQLAAGATHEIRNPLTSIKGFTQLIRNRAIRQNDHTSIGYCDLIIEEIDHINSVVTDFLSLARPNANKTSLLDMVKITGDIVAFMYGEAVMDGIKINANLPMEPLYVEGNIDKLKEVLINICRNGFQAMSPGGILTISIIGDEKTVQIKITDTGCGIAPEDQDNIFKPFYTTKEAGTGLGLSICKRIIQDHGGSIAVHSVLGQGTDFTVILPRQ